MKRKYQCAVYYCTAPEGAKYLQAEQKTAAMQLMKYAFSDFFQIELHEEYIKREPGKKPCYTAAEGCFFNISHCAAAVAVAAAKVPVGIDVEAMRPVKRRTVQKCCGEEELAYVFRTPESAAGRAGELSEEEADRFLKLWTLKESYVKMTGEGLRHPFHDICFAVSEFQKAGSGVLMQSRPGHHISFLYTPPGGIVLSLSLSDTMRCLTDADWKVLWKSVSVAVSSSSRQDSSRSFASGFITQNRIYF